MASTAAQIEALPDEVRALVGPHLAEDSQTLDAISAAIIEKRDDAKTARTSSGVEQIWRMCEEAYEGIDDANRGEMGHCKWSKPWDMSGPVTTGPLVPDDGSRSTAYVMLTARYVNSGAAKVAEILLAPGDKSFSLSPPPDPKLVEAAKDTSHVHHDKLLDEAGRPMPLWRDARPDETSAAAQPATAIPSPVAGATPAAASVPAPAGGAVLAAGAAAPAGPPQPPPGQVPLTVKDLAEEKLEQLREQAKKAETRIFDWMVECQYTAEARKVIFDRARLGVGVLKAPYSKPSKQIVVLKGKDDSIEVQIKERITPAAKWVDPWNIYPDPACGEVIRDGDFCFECDWLSERQVREFKKTPGYIAKQVDKVLKDGPEKVATDAKDRGESTSITTETTNKGRYQVWYFYGALTRDEVEAIWTATGKRLTKAEVAETKQAVYVIATLIGRHLVRASINPLDSGELPYHNVPWQRRPGSWAGKGIAEQIQMPQKSTNAAVRALFNNAGISGGVQIIIDQAAIQPADGSWTITPNKVWYKMPGEGGEDVRQVFMAVEIPNVTESMLKIIDLAMKLGEESTSIPLVTQGRDGQTTPETYGATFIQDTNANTLLRSIGYTHDDFQTEPVVRQFYEWFLLDPDVPNDEKGMFTINAHGSSALVERAIQDQAIAQMGPMVVDPRYGGNAKRWFKMLLKSKRFDPEEICNTKEEQDREDAKPPPEAPQVTAAKIMADSKAKEIVAKQPIEQQTADHEAKVREAALVLEGHRVDAEKDRSDKEHDAKKYVADRDYDKALLQYANQHKITIEQAKVELAKETMRLTAAKDMNAADRAADLHMHHNPSPEAPVRKPQPTRMKPPVQTPGRSGAGRAFEQGPRQ